MERNPLRKLKNTGITTDRSRFLHLVLESATRQRTHTSAQTMEVIVIAQVESTLVTKRDRTLVMKSLLSLVSMTGTLRPNGKRASN
jgi:hypothetical protein